MIRSCGVLAVALVACGGDGDSKPDAPPVIDVAGDTCTFGAAPRAVGNVRGASAELSGLAASRVVDGILWTHGDSGATALVYAIDAATAALRGTLTVSGVTPIDWEDIAAGPCAAGQCIFVADTGDNALARASVAIYEITEPASAASATVTARRRDFTYPDGPQNVEAVIVDPRDGMLYAISKIQGARAKLYAYSAPTAALLGQLPMFTGDDRVTGADFFVDATCGARLLVRTRSELLLFRGPADVAIATLVTMPFTRSPVATEPQGEAIAWRRDGGAYFTVSEGTDPPLYVVEP